MLSTIASRGGGLAIVRDELDFSDWGFRYRNLLAQTVAQIQRTDRELDEVMHASADRNFEVSDFDRAASALAKMEKTTLRTIEAPLLRTSSLNGSEQMMRLRELKVLDKVMQTQEENLLTT